MDEMEQKKQTTTRSYRVDEETAEKIAALGKELGINQNGVFETLLSAYELQQDAALVPDAAKDIETFISHLRAIQDAYHNIVSINAQTEERIRQEFQRRLENQEKQISDLLAVKAEQGKKIEELTAELTDKLVILSSKDKAIAEAEQKISEREKSLADKEKIIESLSARIPEQAETDQRIESLEKESAELRVSLAAAESAKTEAQAKAEKAASDLMLAQTQADIFRTQAEKESETAAMQAAAELKTAVAEARQEERDKAAAKEEKLQAKIEELREKVDEQKDIISDLKAER